ncbi:MAG: hypothetical protein Q8P62_04315 [Candidatus Peregrinibacteria bacterium]|nr:hypothetical protein [Candidatus Peregrinibacteria bacterium]
MENLHQNESLSAEARAKTPTAPTRGMNLKTRLAALTALAGISTFAPEPAQASEGKTTIGQIGFKADQLHLSDTTSQTGGYFLRATTSAQATHLDPYTTQGIAVHGEHFSAGLGAKIPLTTEGFTKRLGGNLTLGYHGKKIGVHSDSIVDGEQWRSETSAQYQFPHHIGVGPVALAEGHFGHEPKVFSGICASAKISEHISTEICAAATRALDSHASINLTYR